MGPRDYKLTLTGNVDFTSPSFTPYTIDELIKSRAVLLPPNEPIISYPEATTSRNDNHIKIIYRDYTAQELDAFATRVAEHYLKCGLVPRRNSDDPEKVVALLAQSNLDYFISTLALTRLGMTVLFLSTRISTQAYHSLLEETRCQDLVVQLGGRFEKIAKGAREFIKRKETYGGPFLEFSYYEMAGREIYEFPLYEGIRKPGKKGEWAWSRNGEASGTTTPNLAMPFFDRERETTLGAWIIHSSGSTGLPKPIRQTHSAAIKNYANNFNMKGFITLPLYHAHGLSSVCRAIHSGKQIHMYSAELPLTGPNIIQCLKAHPPEIFYGVPYALKLLAETDEGLDILRKCKLVMFGGSSCPDVLGDKLVRNQILLVSHYGWYVQSFIESYIA